MQNYKDGAHPGTSTVEEELLQLPLFHIFPRENAKSSMTAGSMGQPDNKAGTEDIPVIGLAEGRRVGS